jgi:hypothetical protein
VISSFLPFSKASLDPIRISQNLKNKIVYTSTIQSEGLFVLRPVATLTSSGSSISGLSTKRLTSTLNLLLLDDILAWDRYNRCNDTA